MAQLTDNQILAAVADALSVAVADLEAKWSTVVTRVNTATWHTLVAALVARGFSLAQVEDCDLGASQQMQMALPMALTQGGGLNDYDTKGIELMDWTERLAKMAVTIDGVRVSPEGTSVVGTGSISTSNDLFVFDEIQW